MKRFLWLIALFASVMFSFTARSSEPIHVATAENNTNTIINLLSEGTDIDTAEINQGCAPLHWAAYFNRREAAKFLLEHGADVNVRNYYGMTPLHYAALCGHYDMVVLLLDNKADINAFDCQGLTPLHMASQYGHEKIIKFLLSMGADIGAKTNYRGLTPLHWAAFWGDTESIKALIAGGADINARDNHGYTARVWAEQNLRYDAARLLARKGCKRHPHDQELTADVMP